MFPRFRRSSSAEDTRFCFEKLTGLEFEFIPILKWVEALALARDGVANELPAFVINFRLVN